MKDFILLFLLVSCTGSILAHVSLMDPPARNVLWRTIPGLPEHKDDDYLLCAQEGKKLCPPCGDNADARKPYPHQAGGKWAYGIIGRNYSVGETIPVSLNVTNSHGGHVEFKLCPNNNVKKPITQECLDQFPLEVVGHRGGKVPVTAPYQETQEINVQLVLPRGLSCKQCVLQMSQYAEQFKPSNVMFRNCADIGILDSRKQKSKKQQRPIISPRIINSAGSFSNPSSQRALRFPQEEARLYQQPSEFRESFPGERSPFPGEKSPFPGPAQNSRFFIPQNEQYSSFNQGYNTQSRNQNGRQSQNYNGPHSIF